MAKGPEGASDRADSLDTIVGGRHEDAKIVQLVACLENLGNGELISLRNVGRRKMIRIKGTHEAAVSLSFQASARVLSLPISPPLCTEPEAMSVGEIGCLIIEEVLLGLLLIDQFDGLVYR